ncbi:MAG TPA: hypothetical protein VF743_00170, partial [Acidimicrobiales bacterium]
MRPTDAASADAPLTAVVVSGGGVGAAPGGPGAGPLAVGPPPAGLVPPGALVIAADSGLERA